MSVHSEKISRKKIYEYIAVRSCFSLDINCQSRLGRGRSCDEFLLMVLDPQEVYKVQIAGNDNSKDRFKKAMDKRISDGLVVQVGAHSLALLPASSIPSDASEAGVLTRASNAVLTLLRLPRAQEKQSFEFTAAGEKYYKDTYESTSEEEDEDEAPKAAGKKTAK